MVSDHSLAVTEYKTAVRILTAPVHREIMEEILHCIFQSCTTGFAVLFKDEILFQRGIGIGQVCPLRQEHIAPQHRRTGTLSGGNIPHVAALCFQSFIQDGGSTARFPAEHHTFVGIGIDEIRQTFLPAAHGRHDGDIIEPFQFFVCFQFFVIFQIFFRRDHKVILHDDTRPGKDLLPFGNSFARRSLISG